MPWASVAGVAMEGCALGSGPSTLCLGEASLPLSGVGGLNTLLSLSISAFEECGGGLNIVRSPKVHLELGC